MRKAFTFDDVLLVPKFSSLHSRSDVSISTRIGSVKMEIPVVSSPMDSVTGYEMAMFMSSIGGLGFIHRYQSIKDQVTEVEYVKSQGGNVGAAVGINGDALIRTSSLIEAGANPIVIDVAHAHTKSAIERVFRIKSEYPSTTLISPNLATYDAAKDLTDAGVDVLRVGIGSGSACTTRVVAGIGVPQLTAIIDARSASDAFIIADGGIRNSGDAVKALAAGADAIMLGGLLGSFPITPNKGVFRGMASNEALSEYKGRDDFTIEGASFKIQQVDNDYKNTMDNFIKGIRLGLSYIGARDIVELQERAEFVQITSNGWAEGQPHFKSTIGGD